MMKYPLISVIVPVYNVEKYLGKCIDSLVSQTYPNLEIVLVDDGSTDNSGRICDSYASQHSQIRVHHRANGGLSAARNSGIYVSTGEYLMFVDSDDWVSTDITEKLFQNLITADADISSCSEYWVYENTRFDKREGTIHVMTPAEAMQDMLYQNGLNHSTWGKLYKRQLFDSVRFPDGILYEDLATFYLLYEQCRVVVHTTARLYYYRQRNDSLTGGFNLRRLDVLDVTDDIERHISETMPRLLSAARDRKLSANFNMMQLLSANGYSDGIHADRCWANIKALRYGSLVDPKVRVKNKIGIITSLLGRRFFQLISRIVS